MAKDYVVNLRNPEDSPEKIAEKLNTLSYALDHTVIRGAVKREEFEDFKSKTTKYINGNKERIDTNDLRWHGGGLSKVTHDSTLSGDGTVSSPLSVLESGLGTVTNVSVITANGVSGTVASATSTPAITLTLGAIVPISVNGVVISGTSTPTLAVTGTTAVSGTNTGDQTITLTGAVTGSGTGTFATTLASGIDATKIANGSVTSTEFQYLDGVTSSIQTQINGKLASGAAGATTQVIFNNAGVYSGDANFTWSPASELAISNSRSLTFYTSTPALASGTYLVSPADGKLNISAFTGSGSATLDLTTISGGTKTFTFPNSTGTFALSNVAQTFTGTQTFSNAVNYTDNAIAAVSNAATVPVTARQHTITNSSASGMVITLATSSAVSGQLQLIRILDSTASAQPIAWVLTENSTVIAPATTNGSTTLPVTVGFQFNPNTSRFRCIASA